MTTTEHIQSNQDLICEFNDLLNSDPEFNYSENEFMEWYFDCVCNYTYKLIWNDYIGKEFNISSFLKELPNAKVTKEENGQHTIKCFIVFNADTLQGLTNKVNQWVLKYGISTFDLFKNGELYLDETTIANL
mgnify:FL=1